MIFSELYSAYYNAVANIIRTSMDHLLKKDEMRNIIEKYAFGESVLTIEPAIDKEQWQVIKRDGGAVLKNLPDMPFTNIEKRWLKAISLDPRIRLFMDDFPEYNDVKPLFTPKDIKVFDKYSDGDNYEDEEYIKTFRLIIDAIKNSYPLRITMKNRTGRYMKKIIIPKTLEYSEKDDKFRVIALGDPIGGTYNLGRITSCARYEGAYNKEKMKPQPINKKKVIFELLDERNALERVMLHFAHLEKEAIKIEDNKYRVEIYYDKDDETEIVIRILSFGPVIKVVEPEEFVNLIKERLVRQKSCGL